MWKKLVANKYLGLLWTTWAIVLVIIFCSVPNKEKIIPKAQAYDELPYIKPLPKRDLGDSPRWPLPRLEEPLPVRINYSFTPVIYDFRPTLDYDFTPTIVDDKPLPHKRETHYPPRRRGLFRRR